MNANSYQKKQRRLESYKRLINLSLTAICLFLEVGIFTYNWLKHFRYSLVEPLRYFYWNGHILEIAIYGVILLLLSVMYGGMRLGYLKNAEIVFSQIFATILADIFIYAELSMMAFQLFVPKVFIVMFMEQCVVVFLYINRAKRY